MSKTPFISVIIPTYNRSEALRKTLLGLTQQTLPANHFEVILIDDGSTEDIPKMLEALNLPYHLHYLQQSQRGPAAARNLGASQSRGNILLFLDSDMIAMPELLQQHLTSHQNANSLVIGPRSCSAESWVEDSLAKFDYRPDGTDPRLDKKPLSFQEAFTCNLSMHKDIWNSVGGFDESYPSASFEDIEFAYRAVKNGLSLKLNPAALAIHHHPLSLKDRCDRSISYTKTVPLLISEYPELCGQITHLKDKEPISWREDHLLLIINKVIRGWSAQPTPLLLLEWSLERLISINAPDDLVRFFYWKVIGAYQRIGLQEGIRLYGWPG